MQILVIVDYYNVYKNAKDKVRLEDIFGEISRKVLEKGTLSEIRLFVPNYQLSTAPWKVLNGIQLKFGVAVSVCPSLRGAEEMAGEEFKDLVDMEVLSWTMKYLHKGVGPELIVFVTGDGDFLVASHEAQKLGKAVEFWTISKESTSSAIFNNAEVREIQIPSEPNFPGSNSFINALGTAQKGGTLDFSCKQKLRLLRRAMEVLDNTERPTHLEEKAATITRELEARLGVDQLCSAEILKALLTVGGVTMLPVASQSLYVDPESPILTWLRRMGSTLT